MTSLVSEKSIWLCTCSITFPVGSSPNIGVTSGNAMSGFSVEEKDHIQFIQLFLQIFKTLIKENSCTMNTNSQLFLLQL